MVLAVRFSVRIPLAEARYPEGDMTEGNEQGHGLKGQHHVFKRFQLDLAA